MLFLTNDMFEKTLTLRFTSFRIKPGMTLPGTFYGFINHPNFYIYTYFRVKNRLLCR
jgi:hypothetical protein